MQELGGIAELARVTLDGSNESIDRILSLARTALDMDVAFVAAFSGHEEIVQAVDGDGLAFGIEPGMSMPIDESYCGRMVNGRLSSLVTDAAGDERTADLPITR